MNIQKIHEFKGHDQGIYALANSADQTSIYSAAGDKMIAKWSLNTLEPEPFAIKLDHTPYSLCVDGALLCAGEATGKMHVFDLDKKAEIKNLLLHKKGIFDIIQIPAKQILVVTCADGSFSVLNQVDYSLRFYEKVSSEKIRKAIYNAVLNRVYLCCGDGNIYIYSLNENKVIQQFFAHDLSCNVACIWPEKSYLFTGGRDAILKVWDIKNNYKNRLEIPAHNYAIYAIKISPCGKFLATASRDKTIKIWDLNTLEVLAKLDHKNFGGHTHSVNTLLWLDKYLVSAGDDRKIMVWGVE